MALFKVSPLRLFGWAAAGVALGVGWKVGAYLVDKAVEDPRVAEFMEGLKGKCQGEGKEAPLWKRQYAPFSE